MASLYVKTSKQFIVRFICGNDDCNIWKLFVVIKGNGIRKCVQFKSNVKEMVANGSPFDGISNKAVVEPCVLLINATILSFMT